MRRFKRDTSSHHNVLVVNLKQNMTCYDFDKFTSMSFFVVVWKEIDPHELGVFSEIF